MNDNRTIELFTKKSIVRQYFIEHIKQYIC